jgi:hypothetical protein
MPWVGVEPTIPVFERAKTVHALDRAARPLWSAISKIMALNSLLYLLLKLVHFCTWQFSHPLWIWPPIGCYCPSLVCERGSYGRDSVLLLQPATRHCVSVATPPLSRLFIVWLWLMSCCVHRHGRGNSWGSVFVTLPPPPWYPKESHLSISWEVCMLCLHCAHTVLSSYMGQKRRFCLIQ